MKCIAHFETITPVFCAGAEQNGPSEIREFPIKGMLRWFYRALDGTCDRQAEGQVFGSASGSGGVASPVVLEVTPRIVGDRSYEGLLNPRQAQTQGECYLGYTLYLGNNRRKAIPPGEKFMVRLTPRWQRPDERVRKAWLASLWLLGHLGGLGTRMRRGFGTIALQGLEGDWPEIASLPLPNKTATSPGQWKSEFLKGFQTIRTWFPTVRPPNPPQPSFPQTVEVLIGPTGHQDPLMALRDIGNQMRTFRNIILQPKYPNVVSFGMPLNSRSQGVRYTPQGYDRSPSRLWIRVIRIQQQYYPLVWWHEGPLSPTGRLQAGAKIIPAPPGLGAIPGFLQDLRNAHGYR